MKDRFMNQQRRLHRRRGTASVDVVLVIGTLFPMCVLLYYVAEICLANLCEIFSVVVGNPVM